MGYVGAGGHSFIYTPLTLDPTSRTRLPRRRSDEYPRHCKGESEHSLLHAHMCAAVYLGILRATDKATFDELGDTPHFCYGDSLFTTCYSAGKKLTRAYTWRPSQIG